MPFAYSEYNISMPWGLYHNDGPLISEAVFSPAGKLENGDHHGLSPDKLKTLQRAPDRHYVYAGLLHNHYGHFLTASLSRLWFLLKNEPEDVCLLFHTGGDGRDARASGVFEAMRSAFNLAADQIEVFTEPTIVPFITTPGPALEDQSFVYPIFADTCRHIGRPYSARPEGPDHPIYLSKSGLESGVMAVENEEIIERVLRQGGVEVLHPQNHSFADQVSWFSQKRTILGVAGSAFHTSIFSLPAARLICLCPHNGFNSNFRLFDLVRGADSTYVFEGVPIEFRHDRPGFTTSYTFQDPEGTAQSLLAMI